VKVNVTVMVKNTNSFTTNTLANLQLWQTQKNIMFPFISKSCVFPEFFILYHLGTHQPRFTLNITHEYKANMKRTGY